VAWAIINGESETGFTYHYMSNDFDTGHIVLQEKIAIGDDDTAFSLFHRQIARAMGRLDDALAMAVGNFVGTPQVGDASYYPRALPFGGMIDASWQPAQIDRFIRAMHFPPFDPAHACIGNALVPVRTMSEYATLLAAGPSNAE
jgi:methionyl-tRNA formyltransferase